MIELNNLVKKEVISIYDCQCYGLTTGIYINKRKKCAYLAIKKDELEYILPTNNIYASNGDCIMIKNSGALSLKCNIEMQLAECYLIDCPKTYNLDGKYYGKISNIIFDEKFNISTINLDSGDNINISNVFNLTDEICLICSDNKPKHCKYKPKAIPKIKPKMEEVTVTILDNAETEKITNNQSEQSKITLPASKINISDTSMLLNRTVTKRIMASNGEIIAREQSKITKDIIKMARINGKLYELVKYSL